MQAMDVHQLIPVIFARRKKGRKQSQSKMLIDSSSVTIQYHRQLQHDTFSEIAYTKASQTFFENWDGGWPNG